MTSISWRDPLYAYQWELLREAYFLRYGQMDKATMCRVLAQIHKNQLKDDQLDMLKIFQ